MGPGASEAYVEAELDLPEGLLEEDELETLRELRPEDEESLVAARRVFADGRTRAYAWGRSVAREDLALLVDRLLAMSGQFEQRRLARPSFQLDLLDSYAGDDQLRRRTEHARVAPAPGGPAPPRPARRGGRGPGEPDRRAPRARRRAPRASTPRPRALFADRLRVRHSADLATAAAAVAEAVAPESGEGAAEPPRRPAASSRL